MNNITYTPIGIIYSPFKEPKGMPIQPKGAKDIEGSVEIFEKYIKGLQNLDGFSHIILLYHFHLSKEYSLTVKPYLDNNSRGVFATRAPSRPNAIGLSVVKLEKIEKNIIHIKNVDIVDGTPVLDIKPYVPQFNPDEEFKIGWLKENISKLNQTKGDDRFNN